MMTTEGSTKIVNFKNPGVGVLVLWCGHISYIVKINYFNENLLLYSRAQIRQTAGIVIMSKEGSTKFVNVMIPKGRDSCARACPNKSHGENASFL